MKCSVMYILKYADGEDAFLHIMNYLIFEVL